MTMKSVLQVRKPARQFAYEAWPFVSLLCPNKEGENIKTHKMFPENEIGWAVIRVWFLQRF